jgi:hypothetical protein
MAAAKRTRSRKGTSLSPKRGSGRRGTVKAKKATFYAKRTARGQLKEMDEKGRSLKADRRVKAKTRPGYGDRGDRTAEAVI